MHFLKSRLFLTVCRGQRGRSNCTILDGNWCLGHGMMKRFSQTTAASASDELVDSAQRKLSFVSDATNEVLAY